MVKKILLTVLIVVVLFLVFRNVDFIKISQNVDGEQTSNFTPSVTDFSQQKILNDSYLTWFGENKIQAKSHTGTLKFDTNVSFLGLAPKNENGDMEVVGGQLLIDMTTLEGVDEPEMLINHLKSADFFDVETYQNANFVITEKADGKVKGFLTIKDVTQTVEVPYTITPNETGYIIEGQFEIDRTLWGVTTLSSSFFEDIGDSVIEDIIKLNFVVYTTN
jgi:polyisoprenoid-binding protein YceI